MIKIPDKIICPWCNKNISDKNGISFLKTAFLCSCNLSNNLTNLSFRVDLDLYDNKLLYIYSFGIFLNLRSIEEFISFDYNIDETPNAIVTLCSYKATDALLNNDAPINGIDLNEVTKNAVQLLKRYEKLLIFS